MDVEAVAVLTARDPAMPVAQEHRTGDLGGQGCGPFPDRDRDPVVIDEDGFDPGVGPQSLDDRVRQRDPRDFCGTVVGDVDHQQRLRGRDGCFGALPHVEEFTERGSGALLRNAATVDLSVDASGPRFG